jgi:hypothetical protein
MPALCFLPAMKRDELIAALKHRIPQIRGYLEHVAFAVAELPSPTVPEHVKELYRLSAARAEAEIPWSEQLLQRLEQGEYEFPPSMLGTLRRQGRDSTTPDDSARVPAPRRPRRRQG